MTGAPERTGALRGALKDRGETDSDTIQGGRRAILMKNNRAALWLLLASQLIFLLGSLDEPPTGLLTVGVRVILPLVLVAYVGLMLAGHVRPGKR